MASSRPKRWYHIVEAWKEPIAFAMGLFLGYVWWGA